MPRPFNKLFTPSAVSTNYFANDVTGTVLTLAQTTTPDGLGHKITVLNNTANSHAGKTITIVGLGPDGAQSETITGPGASATVTSTLYYTTLTSVTFSSTIAPDTVDVGYSSAAAGPAFPLNWRGGLPYIDVVITGTANCTVQYTGDLVNQGATPPFNWITETGSALTSFTATVADGYTVVPIAVRLIFNSYSTGATALFQISQKDI